MSPQRSDKPPAQGLSVTTLAIASVSSIVAAIVIHKFWTGGAILGAGLTPVIVAITSEALKRPTQKVTAIREQRRAPRSRREERGRGPGPRAVPPAAPPPAAAERPDPFGIWADAGRRSWWERIRGRPLKIAIVTGLVAFVLGGALLTGSELVFGGSAAGGNNRVTLFPSSKHKSTKKKDSTTSTTPAPGTSAPAQTGPAQTEPPAATAPSTVATTPSNPTAPAPQGQTTPAPAAPQGTTPAPAPTP